MGFGFKWEFPFFGRQASSLASPEEWLLQAILGGLKTSAGIDVTPEKALGVTTVLSCVNIISRAIATMPLVVYEKTAEGKLKAEDHPLYDLLHLSPSDDLTSSEFIMVMQGNFTLRNNAYALIVRDGMRRVRELIPIDPVDMQVSKEAGKPIEYRVKGEVVDSSQILHLRGLSSTGILGHDTVSLAREAIGLAIALQDDLGRFFKNGARTGSVLTTEQSLKPETIKQLREKYDERHSGAGNQYKTAVLTAGLKPLVERFNNRDSQSVEQRDFQQREIARVFNVALHKIQINDNIPRANNEEQNRQFVTDTLRPYIVQWEQRLNKTLLSTEERKRYSISFIMEGLLRGNTKERYESYQIGRLNGWLNVNEIRAKEDMNGIGPDGDTYIEPMNHQPVGTKPDPEANKTQEEEEEEAA